MAKQNVRFTLDGPHQGRDFSPRFSPQFAFKKGVLDIILDESQVPGVAHLLQSYGATYEIVRHEKPAAKRGKGKKDVAPTI